MKSSLYGLIHGLMIMEYGRDYKDRILKIIEEALKVGTPIVTVAVDEGGYTTPTHSFFFKKGGGVLGCLQQRSLISSDVYGGYSDIAGSFRDGDEFYIHASSVEVFENLFSTILCHRKKNGRNTKVDAIFIAGEYDFCSCDDFCTCEKDAIQRFKESCRNLKIPIRKTSVISVFVSSLQDWAYRFGLINQDYPTYRPENNATP